MIDYRDKTLHMNSALHYKPDESTYEKLAGSIKELFQIFNPRKMEKEDALIIIQNIFQ